MSKYTKRDYELVARVVCDAAETFGGPGLILHHVAGKFAAEFKADNDRFDIVKFTNACGLGKEKL